MTAIDLHTHTTASDGTYTPAELVEYAALRGLSSIAITDHDTVDGLPAAFATASRLRQMGTDIHIIPGVEISAEYGGGDVHIVGLFIDYKNPVFLNILKRFRDSRDARNDKMCALLSEHGIPLTTDILREEFPDCVLTRAHMATYLLEHGYVTSRDEAFTRYVGDRAPCYVPRPKISPTDAIRAIRLAGGVPVFAHPMLCKMGKATLQNLIAEMKEAGLLGIEAYYSTYKKADETFVLKMAAKYDLVPSGGSDFHGLAKKNIDLGYGQGNLPLRDDFLQEIVKRIPKRYLFTDMDGTLFNKKKEITPGTYVALSRMAECGHHIVYSSGRSLDSMLDVLKAHKIGFPGSYISAYNGGLLYECDTDRVLLRLGVELSVVKRIFELAEEIGVHCQTYTSDSIVSLHDTEELRYYCGIIKRPAIIGADALSHLSEEPCKVLAIQLSGRDKKDLLALLQERVLHEFGDSLSSVYSCPEYVEFFPNNAGKGNALKNLCTILKIHTCDTISVGDEENDLSMISEAGIGCAVYNATDAVKASADYVTTCDHNHDAVAEVINNFINLKEREE